jgi:hypothetical protein
MELWALARQPAHRIPTAIVAARQQEYFKWRLAEAIAGLCADAELLGEVLEEILLIATGEDKIVGWRPPELEEMLLKIGEPLSLITSHGQS